MQECVKTGLWVGDCFIYTNGVNRLNYYVGGEIVTISHLDRYDENNSFYNDICDWQEYNSKFTTDELFVTIFSFRTMYLLGYIPADNRLYLGDKELNVVSFQLLLSVLEYQTAVMRRDFETADKVRSKLKQLIST